MVAPVLGLVGCAAELCEWTDEETLLRDALWWADMTTSPDGELIAFNERMKEAQDRYGPEDFRDVLPRLAEPGVARCCRAH